MRAIFEISKDYLNIIDQIEENGGEITEQIETALAINEGEIKQKGVAYAAVIKSLTSENKIIDDEIKRLTARKKSRTNLISNLKGRLTNALNMFNIDEIKTPLIKINFRKSESVSINCPIQDLPDDCKIISVNPLSKTELKRMIKEGREIKGVEVIENKNIQIK